MTMMKRMPVLILLVASALLSCNDIISYKGNLAATGAIVSLATTSGTIGLQSGRFVYPLAVDAKTESIQVRSVLSDASNRMTVNGLPCSSGAWSQVISLPEGRTTPVTIVVSPNVSAPSDADVRTYTIEVSPAMEWGKPEAFLPGEIESQVYHTQVAGNAAGQMLAVWYQGIGTQRELMMAERGKDGEWGCPIRIRRPFSGLPPVTININEKGDAVIAWVDEQNSGILALVKANGKWPNDLLCVEVERIPNSRDIEGIDSGIDDEGDVLIGWPMLPCMVYARVFSATMNKWMEKKAIDGDPFSTVARNPVIGLNKNGNGYIAWIRIDAKGYSDMVRYCSIQDNYVSDQYWTINNSVASINSGIEVTDADLGFFHWIDTSLPAIQTRVISPSGTSLDKPTLIIGSGSLYGENSLVIQINYSGRALAVWKIKETTSGNAMFIVYGAVYDGHSWSEPVRLSEGSANESFHVRACINDQGRGGVVFFDTDQYGSPCISAVEYNGSWSQKSILVQASNLFDVESLTIDGNGAMTCLWTRTPTSGSPMVYQSQYR